MNKRQRKKAFEKWWSAHKAFILKRANPLERYFYRPRSIGFVPSFPVLFGFRDVEKVHASEMVYGETRFDYEEMERRSLIDLCRRHETPFITLEPKIQEVDNDVKESQLRLYKQLLESLNHE